MVRRQGGVGTNWVSEFWLFNSASRAQRKLISATGKTESLEISMVKILTEILIQKF